jgi:hypothetical protein
MFSSPLIDHLLKMPLGQPLPGPMVDENVPLLPVPHIMPQPLAGIAGQLHGLGHTRDVTPGPAVDITALKNKYDRPVSSASTRTSNRGRESVTQTNFSAPVYL